MAHLQEFSLYDVLGWTKQTPLTPSIISLHEATTTPADLLLASFINHTANTGGTVCFISTKYSVTHLSHICKKMGVSLPNLTKTGKFFHIDCMQSRVMDLLSNEPSSEDTSDVVLGKIIISKLRWLKSLTQPLIINEFKNNPHNVARFNVVFDDYSLFSSIYLNDSVHRSLTFAQHISKIVSSPEEMLSLSEEKVIPEIPTHSGSLVLVTSTVPPLHYFQTSTSIVPAPSAVPTANPLLLPTKVKERDANTHHYDLPVASGGLAAAISHWTLRSSSTKANVALDLSPLSSGYSKDIYAQLIIRKGPSYSQIDPVVKACIQAGNYEGAKDTVMGTVGLVYVSVSGDNKLVCHTRG